MPILRPVLLLLLCLTAYAAAPLRMVADNSLAPPMARFDAARNTLLDGIVFDFGTALAAELGRQVHFKVVPTRRTRLLLQSGQADLLCFYAPVWLNEAELPAQRRFLWSHELVLDRDVLLQARKAKPASSLDDLHGLRIGTVHGYVYPALQPLQDAGLIERDDTHSIEANLAKLRAGRLDAAVVNEVNFRYLRKLDPALDAELQQTLTLHEAMLACAVSRRSAIPFARLDAAIRTLITRGDLAWIYQRYQ